MNVDLDYEVVVAPEADGRDGLTVAAGLADAMGAGFDPADDVVTWRCRVRRWTPALDEEVDNADLTVALHCVDPVPLVRAVLDEGVSGWVEAAPGQDRQTRLSWAGFPGAFFHLPLDRAVWPAWRPRWRQQITDARRLGLVPDGAERQADAFYDRGVGLPDGGPAQLWLPLDEVALRQAPGLPLWPSGTPLMVVARLGIGAGRLRRLLPLATGVTVWAEWATEVTWEAGCPHPDAGLPNRLLAHPDADTESLTVRWAGYHNPVGSVSAGSWVRYADGEHAAHVRAPYVITVGVLCQVATPDDEAALAVVDAEVRRRAAAAGVTLRTPE